MSNVQIRTYSEILEVKTSTYEFLVDVIQPIPVGMVLRRLNRERKRLGGLGAPGASCPHGGG